MPELLRAGPASMVGLRWLARVGPSPTDAWACAMGWGLRSAQSHSQRLERAGWLTRYAMTRGRGSLLVANHRGVRVAELALTAAPDPAPVWWAHHCACAWTAAWLTTGGAPWAGPREILADPSLTGTLEWQTRTGCRRAAHRPDLTLTVPEGRVIVEVELQRKADNRLAAILSMYRQWLDGSRIVGVVYVCDNANLAERIRSRTLAAGLPASATRVELLDTIHAQATGART